MYMLCSNNVYRSQVYLLPIILMFVPFFVNHNDDNIRSVKYGKKADSYSCIYCILVKIYIALYLFNIPSLYLLSTPLKVVYFAYMQVYILYLQNQNDVYLSRDDFYLSEIHMSNITNPESYSMVRGGEGPHFIPFGVESN